MNDNSGDIEKLFRESFDSFEADVDPTIWNNISGQIGANAPVPDPASSTSVSSGAASTGAGFVKIALIAGTAGLLTFAGYKMFFDDKGVQADVKTELEHVLEENKDSQVNAIPSHQSLNNDEKVSGQLIENINVEDEKITTAFNEQEGNKSTHQENQSEQKRTVVSKPIVDNTNTEESPITQKPVAKNTAKVEAKASEQSESVAVSPEERIRQKQIFEASIFASSKSGVQPLEVHFENRGTYADDVLWIFRDGSTDRSQNTSHTFTNSGTYMVVLEIRDQNGNISKDSLEISVSGKAHLNVPNTFTPNGDGINDAFMIESEYVQNMSCEIFDRSNNLVHSWNRLYGHWDGRDMNGNNVPPGVYFYVIKAVDTDGKKLDPKKGTVTLFR